MAAQSYHDHAHQSIHLTANGPSQQQQQQQQHHEMQQQQQHYQYYHQQQQNYHQQQHHHIPYYSGSSSYAHSAASYHAPTTTTFNANLNNNNQQQQSDQHLNYPNQASYDQATSYDQYANKQQQYNNYITSHQQVECNATMYTNNNNDTDVANAAEDDCDDNNICNQNKSNVWPDFRQSHLDADESRASSSICQDDQLTSCEDVASLANNKQTKIAQLAQLVTSAKGAKKHSLVGTNGKANGNNDRIKQKSLQTHAKLHNNNNNKRIINCSKNNLQNESTLSYQQQTTG